MVEILMALSLYSGTQVVFVQFVITKLQFVYLKTDTIFPSTPILNFFDKPHN